MIAALSFRRRSDRSHVEQPRHPFIADEAERMQCRPSPSWSTPVDRSDWSAVTLVAVVMAFGIVAFVAGFMMGGAAQWP